MPSFIRQAGDGEFVLHRLTAMPRPRIFQIGFHRCGTTSLHGFFLRNGIPSVHWDERRLALRFAARMARGEDPVADYPETIAFTDMMSIGPERIIEPYKQFDYIRRHHPDAYFLLNTRDRERWIESRLNHIFPLAEQYAAILGIPVADVPDYWRGEWEGHHARVRAAFAGSDRFLEFDIEKDDPARLVEWLAPDFPGLDARHYRWLHRSSDRA